MQHANILRGDNMYQLASLQLPYLNEVWFKRKEVRMREGKGLRPALPVDNPIRSRSPTVSIYKE